MGTHLSYFRMTSRTSRTVVGSYQQPAFLLRCHPKLATGEGWMTEIFLQISTHNSLRGAPLEIQCPEKQLSALTQRKVEVPSPPSTQQGWTFSYSLVLTF